MFKFLPSFVRGSLVFFGYLITTIATFFPLLFIALLKLSIPYSKMQNYFSSLADTVANLWVGTNKRIFYLVNQMKIDASKLEGIKRKGWYLVISNHQSSVDIVVLQHLLHRKIPLLKFFIKKQLFYVPFIGLMWWGLGFSFYEALLERFSEEKSASKRKRFGMYHQCM